MKYLKLKSVINRVKRNIKVSTFNDIDLAEMIVAAFEEIKVAPSLTKNLAFLNIKNGRAKLPKHFDTLMRAYLFFDTLDEDISCDDVCNVKSEILPNIEDIDCRTCGDDDIFGVVVYDIDINKNIVGSIPKNNNIIPIKPGDYHMTSNIVCGYDEQKEKLSLVGYVYDINDGEIIFNFQSGIVALFYLGMPVDKDGIIKIPDNTYVLNAIEYYILKKHSEYQLSIGRRQAYNTLKYFNDMFEKYKTRAKASLRLQAPIDKMRELQELNTLLPYNNYYKL